MKINKKVLVTGGAGYIGSFTVRALRQAGYELVVFDNLSQGHKEAIEGFRLVKGDLVTEPELLEALLEKEKFGAVVHFAAFIQMGESYHKPERYFRNNVVGSLNLLEATIKAGIDKFVFSSSAGVYGDPERVPIEEEDRKIPTNPYGETKLMIEKMLFWFEKAYGLHSISIRYFNAAGAALDSSIGEDHPEESHLIPLAIKAALAGQQFNIFGQDYPTPDGTCVRDYIHVLDLSEAHLLALKALEGGAQTAVYNAGVGKGYSNLQIVEMIRKVTGIPLRVQFGPRRPGDAAALYASSQKIKKELGWEAKYSNLETIIKTAWLWHKSHPRGFSS